jgi:hypothetical protein
MTTTTAPTIRPFEVHVPEEDLADLQRRITATRLRSNGSTRKNLKWI